MKLAAREGDPKGVEDQQKAFQLEMKKVLTQIPSEIEETLEEAEKSISRKWLPKKQLHGLRDLQELSRLS